MPRGAFLYPGKPPAAVPLWSRLPFSNPADADRIRDGLAKAGLPNRTEYSFDGALEGFGESLQRMMSVPGKSGVGLKTEAGPSLNFQASRR